jgi:hypothetical protein
MFFLFCGEPVANLWRKLGTDDCQTLHPQASASPTANLHKICESPMTLNKKMYVQDNYSPPLLPENTNWDIVSTASQICSYFLFIEF